MEFADSVTGVEPSVATSDAIKTCNPPQKPFNLSTNFINISLRMDIEWIRDTCNQFSGVTEDIKWEHDLCFSVGNKMFLVIGIDSTPVTASFKVSDELFDEISARQGFKPAPYMAKNKWVFTEDINIITKKEWKQFIRQSYELVKSKLSKKLQRAIDER